MTFDIDRLPYVPARLFKVNTGRPIDWIVWHSMEAPEGPQTAENVARYFQSPAARGSAHINVDNNSAVRSVADKHQAAHAPGSNTNGLGLELAGTAKQTRAEWLDPYSLDTIDNGSNIAAQWHRRYSIPLVYLTANDLKAGRRGWTTHHQVSLAFGRSSHWDPGPNFPREHVQARIIAHYYGEDEMGLTAEQSKKIDQTHEWTRGIWEALIGTDVPAWGAKNPRHLSVVTRLGYMFAESIGSAKNLEGYRTLITNAVKSSGTIDELGDKLDKLTTDLKALSEAGIKN